MKRATEMIKLGDIVYQTYRGGFLASKPKTNRLGLVIKEYKEKGAIPQYYVKFNQDTPKWYYQHDLHKITGRERNQDD
jgi:hypothetical protein